MRVYIYKNLTCMPEEGIGEAIQLFKVSEVDEFIFKYIGATPIIDIPKLRIFITDDDVGFDEVDNIIMLDEPIGLSHRMKKIKEIDAMEVARTYHKALVELNQRRADTIARLQTQAANGDVHKAIYEAQEELKYEGINLDSTNTEGGSE